MLGGIVLPAVLLAGVVGAGVLGPHPVSEPSPPPAARATAGPVTGVIPAPASPAPTPAPTPAPGAGGPFPPVVAGIAVSGVPEAQMRIRSGSSGPLAVAGYLTGVKATGACASAVDPAERFGPLCERVATLLSQPAERDGSKAAASGSVMQVRLPVGTRLPDGMTDTSAPAVVIVGRELGPPEACDSVVPCRGTFTADQVAWASGAVVDVEPLLDPMVDPTPPEWILVHRATAEALASGFSGTVLVSALVRPETVAVLDQAASRALETTPPAGNLVWYVRSLETAYGSMRYPQGDMPPRLSWVVVDDLTGETLAWGTE